LRTQNEKVFLANQQLQASEENLKQLNATKDKFFSIISHDLKNPFTSLLSISELMATDYKNLDEDEKEHGIKGVHDSATRIYNLLENLLTWARSQTGKITYNPACFDIKEVVDDNMMLHKEQAAKKHLSLEYSGTASILAHGDAAMISTVIRNLLSNAIKFTPDGRTIRIMVEEIEGKWKISIKDQGVGISKENQGKIFQIEKKYKTEGTSGEKGTGLGLLICKEFVEKNGGTLVVESKEGEGSTFSFTVPKWGHFIK
jgi:signal transduction histidine kinase